jgi:hypothetical protein
MEEEREKRKQWWKEQSKLSPEEREKMAEEYGKREFKHYLNLSPEVLLAEAQVHSTFDSILAGLMLIPLKKEWMIHSCTREIGTRTLNWFVPLKMVSVRM